MKNKEYLNIVFGRISPQLKSYNLSGKELHLVNDTFKFILNSDNILRDLFVLSSAHKLNSFVNYILFILKKIEEDKINYSNLSYNVDTDTKFLEKEITRYFSVGTVHKEVNEDKKVNITAKKKEEPVEEVNEYTDETISDFYSSADDPDNEITSENQAMKRGTLELLDVERNDDELNAVFDLPETQSIEESYLPSDIREEITSEPGTTESDEELIREINDFNGVSGEVSGNEIQSEFEKFSNETVSADEDVDSIKEEVQPPTVSDNSYWDAEDDIAEEVKQEEDLNDIDIIEEETDLFESEEESITEETRTPEIKQEELKSEEVNVKNEQPIEAPELKQAVESERKPEEKEIDLGAPVQSEMVFEAREPEAETKNTNTGTDREKEKSNVLTEDVLSDEVIKNKGAEKIESQYEEVFEEKKKTDDFFEQKNEETKEERIEESNEEFVQYENYVLKTNEELRYDFEKMVEFAKRLNKNYDERNLIIKEVIEKTSFLENCSRELSLEVITNIYETFKLSFEKISDGKYDLSEDTLSIFFDSLSLIESLLKGDDYLAYDSLIKSLDKLRKNLLKEKKMKEKEEQKIDEEKSTETVLTKLYEDEHRLFIANNIRRKISDVEKIFNSLNDIESNYVQIEALTLLASNLNNFKELVSYANSIGLVSLAKVAEGGYILIKYLQNYRKDPTEEIWKETFKYIIYVMRLLILDKPVEDLDLFISYLNEPIKIYLSKEQK